MSTVTLTLHVHHVTDKAVLVSEDGNRGKATWVPRSQVMMDDDVEPDECADITMPEWLATDKGLV
jgi:hypothetical protein